MSYEEIIALWQAPLIFWFIVLSNQETKQMFYKDLAVEACPRYPINK